MLALLSTIAAVALPQQPSATELPAAAAAGLGFLARTQEVDGGWPDPPMRAHDRFVDTTFAALAFVAAGERVDGGRFHPVLREAVRFLQERIPPQGPLRVDRPRSGGWQRMETWYAAFALLLFAEVHAVTPAPEFADVLQRLQRRLAHLQKAEGGWCHDLSPRVREIRGLGRAEYSEDLAAVGAFALAALQAAARSGVVVDTAMQARGAAWLSGLCNPDGGVAYGLHHTWPDAVRSEPGRTAAALWALLPQWGRGDARALAAAEYLDANFRRLPNSEGHGGKEFLVSHLAAAMACRVWSDEAVARYEQVLAPSLLRRQHGDGHFVLGNGAWDTTANNTAIAVFCLLAPHAALTCAERAAAVDDAAARGSQRLRQLRGADGALAAKWGGRRVDLAVTALAVRAWLAEDPLGGRQRAQPSLQWLGAEIERLHAADFVDDTRSHFGFQLPVVLQTLAACADEPACRRAAGHVLAELVRSQRDDGGFGYDFGELYTLCVATSDVAIAFAAAAAAGIPVDAAVSARALDYLERCQGEGGGFRYCPEPSHPILAKDPARYRREEVGRTVGAVAALVRGGRGGGAAVERGLEYLARELRADGLGDGDKYLWFTLLQGHGARDAMAPGLRRRWDEIVRARLAALQRADGTFAWPGMAWAAVLGRPAMHEPYATAAGTLLAACYRRERP